MAGRQPSPFSSSRLVTIERHHAQRQEIPVMLAKYLDSHQDHSVVAFLLIALTGMGLFAVMNLRSINANTVDITTNWLPSVLARSATCAPASSPIAT